MSLRNIEDLSVFIRIVDRGSFSAAARVLDLSPTTVSKQIARLEKQLGVTLFERSTRSVRITDEGKAIAEKVRAALALVDEAVEIANNGSGKLSGLIKITAPTPFGRQYVAKAIAKFRKLYPGVGFVLQLTDTLVDLYANEIDLAIRVGHLSDSRLIARRVAENRRILVASPEYVKQYGEPQHPAELSGHTCLLFAHLGSLRANWRLCHNKQVENIALNSELVADSGDALKMWCLAGLGIALRETWDVAQEIKEGTLVQVLAQWQEDTTPISIVRAAREHVPQRIKTFIQFLSDEWRTSPWQR